MKGLGEKGQASKISHQGENQEIYGGETSSGQAKHKSRKLLSSHENKIAAIRALMDEAKGNPEVLQSFKKKLNDKKERELSLLESNPEIARRRLQPSGVAYNYTQLTPTEAQAQLKYSQAFQEATQYLREYPDWNNTYVYQGVLDYNTAKRGIVVKYPSEGRSTIFLAIDDPSTGNNTIGLLGQFIVQSNESGYLAWSTPQGKTFAANVLLGPNWSDTNEVLVSGDINWGNFTFSPVCFTYGALDPYTDCMSSCVKSLFEDQLFCSSCVLNNGPDGIDAVKSCNNPYHVLECFIIWGQSGSSALAIYDKNLG